MTMMDAQEGKPLPYPPLQRKETTARQEKKAEPKEPGAASDESERSEPKAARSTLRNKPSRKLKLVMPKAGADGMVSLKLDKDGDVRESWQVLIAEGQEFHLE